MIITNRNDNYRTGSNLTETHLTSTNISDAKFGKLFERKVDGSVYAQPLVVPDLLVGGQQRTLVFVATMHNSVYAFDAVDPNASDPVWHQHLENSVQLPANDIGWGLGYKDISWEVGILSTPVIDTDRGTLWCVSASRNQAGTAIHTLWKLQLTDGTKLASTQIAASLPNAIFRSNRQVQRSALTLANDRIYIPFAAYGDQRPYHGWVLAYGPDALNAREAFTTTANIDANEDSGAGIWQAGQGPSVDDAGNLYVMTGNSTFDDTKGNYGDCVLKLSPDLKVLDFFTPHNTAALNDADNDLGSGGILVIPNTHLCCGGGKESFLYLMDQNSLGRFDPNTDHVVQRILIGDPNTPQSHHIHGSPTCYPGPSGTRLYLWPENDNLKSYSFAPGGVNILSTDPISASAIFGPDINPTTHNPEAGGNLGMPGGFHSISANGNTPDTGIIWANHPYTGDANQAIVPGILRAFDAYDLTKQLWNSRANYPRDDLGNFAKFCCPTISGGRVYQATMGGLQQKSTLPHPTTGTPALVNQGDTQLVLAWRSPDGTLTLMTSPDGLTWDPATLTTIPGEQAAAPPSLAHDPTTSTTYLTYPGADPNHPLTILQTTSTAPALASWGSKHTTPDPAPLGASLAFTAGLLFAAWLAPDFRITIACTRDGGATWAAKTTLSETSAARPWLGVRGSALVLSWTGTGNQAVNFLECADPGAGLEFGGKVTLGGGIASGFGPAVWSGGGETWLCWTGADGGLNQVVSEDGTVAGFKAVPDYRRGFGEKSTAGPGLGGLKGGVYVVWVGNRGVDVAVLNRGSVVGYGLLG